MNATRDLEQHDPPKIGEPPGGQILIPHNWSQFALNELVSMIGRQDVRSVTDAYLKSTSLLQVLQTAGHPNYFFRGHRNIEWSLIPRKGRELIDAVYT